MKEQLSERELEFQEQEKIEELREKVIKLLKIIHEKEQEKLK